MSRENKFKIGTVRFCPGGSAHELLAGFGECVDHGMYVNRDYDDEAEVSRFLNAEPVFELPHQCDAWRIGNVEDAKNLIAELEGYIARYYAARSKGG